MVGSKARRKLEQLAHEPLARGGRELPGENIRIEEVPAFGGADARPGLRARLDQPLADQNLGRLAEHRAADAELLAPVGLVRQRLSGRQLAADDTQPDGVDHTSRQSTAGDRRLV